MKIFGLLLPLAAFICAIPALVLPTARHIVLVDILISSPPECTGKFESGTSDYVNSDERAIKIHGAGREGSQCAEEEDSKPDPGTSHWEASLLKAFAIDEEPTCPTEGEYCGRDPKNPRKLWGCPGLRCTSQFDDWPTRRPPTSTFPNTLAMKVVDGKSTSGPGANTGHRNTGQSPLS